jgi:hypothetical protein
MEASVAEEAVSTTETEDILEEVVEPAKPVSPFDLPGDWYVIHSYSGYENKVKLNLETRTKSMHMEDRIYDVQIPMEDVVEIKNGKKVTVKKKVFPGYILVRMRLDDDSWYTVRNTPGSWVSKRRRRSQSRASSLHSTSTTWCGSSPDPSQISTAGSRTSTSTSRKSPCSSTSLDETHRWNSDSRTSSGVDGRRIRIRERTGLRNNG